MITLGQRITELKTAKFKKHDHAADAIGIGSGHLSEIGNDKYTPMQNQLQTLAKIASVLTESGTLEELFQGVDFEPQNSANDEDEVQTLRREIYDLRKILGDFMSANGK